MSGSATTPSLGRCIGTNAPVLPALDPTNLENWQAAGSTIMAIR